MGKKNLIAIGVLFVVLLGAIFVTLFLISSNQDTRSSADTPDVFPTAPPFLTDVPVDVQDGETDPLSEDPGPVEAVSVNHPYVSGDAVDYTRASCSWDSNPNADQYNLKITEVDSGSTITNEIVSSDMTEYVIEDISSGGRYRCEVSALNTTGVAGIAGVDEKVCEIPASVVEPTIPPVVTAPPVVVEPTATPIAQAPVVQPTLPPPGSIGTIATVGLGGIILFLIGGALLFL